MAVTIKQVSERCKLSVSAISKALNNYPDISLQTREYVQRVAREMGYRPNPLSRAAKGKRSYNVGILLLKSKGGAAPMRSSFAATASSFREQMVRYGYDVTFIEHDADAQSGTCLSHCLKRNVDGVCVLYADFADPQVMELMCSGLPVVTVDHRYEGRPCVSSDHCVDMRKLVCHAAQLGHRRIAFVHGGDSAVTAQRLAGYREGLREAGLEVDGDYLVRSEYQDPLQTAQATKRLMRLAKPPTCILMPDDRAALGGLEALRGMGLRVPRDVSVAGCEGIDLLQMTRPRLTTIAQDTARIGIEAAEQLVAQVERRAGPSAGPVIVPSRLLVGETVARI